MKEENLNIGIFGVGAIGTVVAFALNQNHNIYYFNRSDKITLNLIAPDNKLRSKNINLSKTEDNLNLDWLIICIKEYHYEKAINDISTLISATKCYCISYSSKFIYTTYLPRKMKYISFTIVFAAVWICKNFASR